MAAMTTWWPLALTATTRSSEGMPSGGPASMRAWPVRAAARACAGGSIGTRRSAPGDTSVIRPWASSTWTVSVPGATGTGLGSRFWSMSAATSTAPCRAETSSPRTSDTRRALSRSTAAAARASASPAEVISVSRARRLRCRHHRAGPLPAGTERWPATSAPVGGEPVPGPAHGLQGALAERRVDLAPQVPRVNLDHVQVRDRLRVPDVLEQFRLRHHLARPPHEVLEQRELPGGQLDHRVAAAHGPGGRVEVQVTRREHRRARPGAAAQQ